VLGFARSQGALAREDAAVDLEDRRLRVGEQLADLGVQRAVLGQELAHVLGTAARRRLVGRARHPLDEVGLEECADAHQHAAHRAVAADVVADAS
jgi:hypothetical protein